MDFKNKRALITGGAKGIGFAAAKRLVKEGCEVILWDLDEIALEKAKDELTEAGGRVRTYVCDISSYSDVVKTAGAVKKDTGIIDILINNAGYVRGGGFLDESIEEWDTTVSVNLNGIIYCTKAFLPDMYEQNSGIIVNISSASALIGVPGLSVYTASKWAVRGFTESMRLESKKLGKKGVKWSSIHPGYIATGMFEGARLRGLGSIIAPLLKDHDVIAKAIVEKAIKKGEYSPKRPRTIHLMTVFRGILPDRVFQALIPLLGISGSMDDWKGRGKQ